MKDDRHVLNYFSNAFAKGNKEGAADFPKAAFELCKKAIHAKTERGDQSIFSDHAVLSRTLEKLKLYDEFDTDAYAALTVKCLEAAMDALGGEELA